MSLERPVRLVGLRDHQMNPSDIAPVIHHESSGAPRSFSDWDRKASRGNRSSGLMDTTVTNFRRYAINEYPEPGRRKIGGTGRFDGSVSNVPGVISVRNGGLYRPY